MKTLEDVIYNDDPKKAKEVIKRMIGVVRATQDYVDVIGIQVDTDEGIDLLEALETLSETL